MGKVFRLPWELHLLLSCFGLSALYSRIYCNRWPNPPAWHPSTSEQYGSGKFGSIWEKKRGPLTTANICLCIVRCLQQFKEEHLTRMSTWTCSCLAFFLTTLKGQCHEQNITLYHKRCSQCTVPLGRRPGFTSSVQELAFFNMTPSLCKSCVL